MRNTAILIPVYNEQEALSSLLGKIKNVSSEVASPIDIFVIDDGSQDETAEIAEKFTPYVFSFKKNRGVGTATRTGFIHILGQAKKYDFILKLDGDGQHDPTYIPKIVEHLREGYDVVSCSRFHSESDQRYTPHDRIFLNGSFAHMVNMVTNWDLTDARTGFMGFQRDLVEKILPYMEVERYGVPIEILLLAYHVKPDLKIIEFAHPAVYGGLISSKLKDKYSKEEINDKADRMADGYKAFLMTIQKLKIPREKLMKVNGFKHL